ncbi:uncharacterized protein BDR25DRAFT_359598 [Lindgomyces ingoldianus]|uniref:Uncharacterized protein n=1 Tax=Lindgomyces ingoldianus TaxID=673940 RepID=A0ACB6QH24_9PLEO|nr:uncharacterized protein BDR25DRAFT_359598 [Lindgomyces ingoldianus]KAF2466231.1 hypothetical protein BDR25DRAFT_359598 [Lindgomyces ingoldianus]
MESASILLSDQPGILRQIHSPQYPGVRRIAVTLLKSRPPQKQHVGAWVLNASISKIGLLSSEHLPNPVAVFLVRCCYHVCSSARCRDCSPMLQQRFTVLKFFSTLYRVLQFPPHNPHKLELGFREWKQEWRQQGGSRRVVSQIRGMFIRKRSLGKNIHLRSWIANVHSETTVGKFTVFDDKRWERSTLYVDCVAIATMNSLAGLLTSQAVATTSRLGTETTDLYNMPITLRMLVISKILKISRYPSLEYRCRHSSYNLFEEGSPSYNLAGPINMRVKEAIRESKKVQAGCGVAFNLRALREDRIKLQARNKDKQNGGQPHKGTIGKEVARSLRKILRKQLPGIKCRVSRYLEWSSEYYQYFQLVEDEQNALADSFYECMHRALDMAHRVLAVQFALKEYVIHIQQFMYSELTNLSNASFAFREFS